GGAWRVEPVARVAEAGSDSVDRGGERLYARVVGIVDLLEEGALRVGGRAVGGAGAADALTCLNSRVGELRAKTAGSRDRVQVRRVVVVRGVLVGGRPRPEHAFGVGVRGRRS